MDKKIKKDEEYVSGLSATALKPMAAVIYAAAADQDDNMMRYVGSTLLNRFESGRAEFGAENGSMMEVINKGYYEKNSKLFEEFMSGNFRDEKSRKAAMRAASIASALARKSTERMPGEFWFNAEEEGRLRKNKKAFNFDLVEDLGPIGKKGQFKMYGYPKQKKSAGKR